MKKILTIVIEAFSYTAQTTIGKMFLDYDGKHEFFGYTLEDTLRPANIKVHGETAIPRGLECDVSLYNSPKFGPTLIFHTEKDRVTIKVGDLTFRYVETHGGNKHSDTEACVIVARNLVDADTIQGSLKKELRNFIEKKIEEGYTIKAKFTYLPQVDNSMLKVNFKKKIMTKIIWKFLGLLAIAILVALLTYKILNLKDHKSELPSKTYYVATNGSDANPGTISQPFATWQKGFSTVMAGELLYIRGGVYKPSGVNANNIYFGYCGVYINGKNGTATAPINVRRYQDEVPILDCINLTQPTVHTGVLLFNCNYWNLFGLVVMNAKQLPGTRSGKGFLGYNVNNCKFEYLVGHDNGGTGISIKWDSDNNLILNCDGYNNVDQYSSGDDADGIELSFIQYRSGNPRKNTIRGSRGWHNSDDGIDCYSNDGILIVDSCWTWGNGAYMGIGSGIKVGSSNRTEYAVAGITQRVTTNCISAFNDAYGYAANNTKGITKWYNNISFHHVSPSTRYSSYGYERWHNNYSQTYHNNISLEDQNTISSAGTGTGQLIASNNSWNNLTATRADFTSVDTTQLKLPRKDNGSLPDITAFTLKAGSKLVDAGFNVGLKFEGKAPDLGPFEYKVFVPPVEPPVDTVIVPPVTPPVHDTIYLPSDTVFVYPPDTIILKVRKGTKVIIGN